MDINHPGPVVVHLSQVPEGEETSSYNGTGEWVKIHTLGLEIRTDHVHPVNWFAYNEQKVPARVNQPKIVVFGEIEDTGFINKLMNYSSYSKSLVKHHLANT